MVVLVTDGQETCKGDPAEEVQRLSALGLEATINIVGLALDDEELKASMEGWAELGGGTFFDAQDRTASPPASPPPCGLHSASTTRRARSWRRASSVVRP